jgi:hypothetical protein
MEKHGCEDRQYIIRQQFVIGGKCKCEFVWHQSIGFIDNTIVSAAVHKPLPQKN